MPAAAKQRVDRAVGGEKALGLAESAGRTAVVLERASWFRVDQQGGAARSAPRHRPKHGSDGFEQFVESRLLPLLFGRSVPIRCLARPGFVRLDRTLSE